jgi:hypothetical protein
MTPHAYRTHRTVGPHGGTARRTPLRGVRAVPARRAHAPHAEEAA